MQWRGSQTADQQECSVAGPPLQLPPAAVAALGTRGCSRLPTRHWGRLSLLPLPWLCVCMFACIYVCTCLHVLVRAYA